MFRHVVLFCACSFYPIRRGSSLGEVVGLICLVVSSRLEDVESVCSAIWTFQCSHLFHGPQSENRLYVPAKDTTYSKLYVAPSAHGTPSPTPSLL
jgi:hypothetical protein